MTSLFRVFRLEEPIEFLSHHNQHQNTNGDWIFDEELLLATHVVYLYERGVFYANIDETKVGTGLSNGFREAMRFIRRRDYYNTSGELPFTDRIYELIEPKGSFENCETPTASWIAENNFRLVWDYPSREIPVTNCSEVWQLAPNSKWCIFRAPQIWERGTLVTEPEKYFYGFFDNEECDRIFINTPEFGSHPIEAKPGWQASFPQAQLVWKKASVDWDNDSLDELFTD